MKIGIVGGTFDPIHRGHIHLGREARIQLGLDEIWFMPAGQPYLKQGRGVSSPRERLAMTRRALEQLDWARVCDMEIKREGPSYTYETLEELRRLYPAHSFYFLMGADCLDQLERWRYPERILAGATLVAAGRQAKTDYGAMQDRARSLMDRFGGDIRIMAMEEWDISSTMIREKAGRGESLAQWVPQGVASFIRRQGLYGPQGGAGTAPRAVIFDMDGTLLDTENMFIQVWEKADGKPSQRLRDALLAIIGVTRQQAEQIIYRRMGADYPYETYRKAVDEAFVRARERGELPLKPYAREILRHLRQEGFLLALASSTISELVRPEMEQLGMADYLDEIVCGDQVEKGKPAPDIFLEAAARLGVAPASCFAIEDSLNGVSSAHAAGMRVIMVPDVIPPDTNAEKKAEHIASGLQEAETYLLKAGQL